MNNPQSDQLKKVLIVDDNRIIRQLLRLTFSNTSRFQLFEADSGEQALPLVISQKPDYIILDVMMPGELNGYQICQMIKSWKDTCHSKIIILSARGQQDDLETGYKSGADHYIVKPFSPAELMQWIDSNEPSQPLT